MSLYRRKDSPIYWIALSHNGRRIQKSTGTTDRKQAKEYHDKLKARLWDEKYVGRKRYSWKDAVVRWLKEKAHKATADDDVRTFVWLDRYLGDFELGEINRDVLERIIEAKKAEGASNATVNRYLALVRGVLRKAAQEWEWLDRYPKFRKLPEPRRRVRYLTREQAERLIEQLPEHLAAMVRFTLETGLRESNVTGLQWSQVDIERRTAWMHADQTKNRRALPIPLTRAALNVLREQKGRHSVFVFTYKGKRVTEVNTKAWKKALKRAGIEDFRWHDLRHTWASWHAQAGTPMSVLQELGGWETADMVRRYAHLSSEHLSGYAERMSAAGRDSKTPVATILLRSGETHGGENAVIH